MRGPVTSIPRKHIAQKDNTQNRDSETPSWMLQVEGDRWPVGANRKELINLPKTEGKMVS